MTTESITSITDRLRKQCKRFVEGAADKVLAEAEIDKDGLQRLIVNSGVFQVELKELIEKYSIEEVKSSYTYPYEYRGPKPINDQIKAIAEIFGLHPSHALEFAKILPELPNGAEGWFAIPTVEAVVTKHFPEVTDPADRYCRAVELVLGRIGKSRKFSNYEKGLITPNRLRQHVKSVKAFQKLGDEQKGHDILIVPAQFGLRHRGRSVRRARKVMNGNEFGLGAFGVGCMLLTHPEREVKWIQLHMDCAGDEFAPAADGDFSLFPLFRFGDGEVKFDHGWYNRVLDRFGSVSGFLSQ